jgi:putative tryptophan/tyrosine transport system substrate-binding protein
VIEGDRVIAGTRPSRRRVVAAVSAVLLSRAAWAQQPGRVYRVGGMSSLPARNPLLVEWLNELGRLGFVEGQNLTIDEVSSGLRPEQFPEAAARLVKAGVDVLWAGGDPAIRAAQEATATIPILGMTDDMLGSGLVRSMARPDGNTTGISLMATELDGKRQEILIEMVPGTRRIAALADAGNTTSDRLQGLRDAAHARGVELSIYRLVQADEVANAIEAAKAAGADGLNILASPLWYSETPYIMQQVAALRLPAIYQWPDFAEQGGLAGYGPRMLPLFRASSRQLAKLLKGAKPADVPVEQPSTFELVVNLKVAKALGLTLSRSFLNRTDAVVE